ncbi:hypothetical protein ACTPOK_09370 [Streptomyces inhibens]|uniref:hypothetical protein n=1 Tax=Streptomyces inhibens TaxID=2293571 RepID=UPI00402AA4E7
MTSEASAGTHQPLTSEQADASHIQVHAPYLAAHPELLDAPPPTEPAHVWCTAKLPDDVWWRSAAVHEAAHALIAWALGLEVKRLSLGSDRTVLDGGGCWVDGEGDAQNYTLVWLSAGHAQANWLTAHGYTHPELRRCVLELGASGDQRIVDGYAAAGFVLDRDQAVTDALQILAEPRAAAALNALAGVLLIERELDTQRINETILVQHAVRPPASAVWIPGRRLPLVAAPPR